jgi:hypothetical protein
MVCKQCTCPGPSATTDSLRPEAAAKVCSDGAGSAPSESSRTGLVLVVSVATAEMSATGLSENLRPSCSATKDEAANARRSGLCIA